MRSRGVEVLPPFGDGAAGVIEAEEQSLVQKLIAHPAVEALDVAILHRLARCDVGTPPVKAALMAEGERRKS